MPRKCTVCAHKSRKTIDKLLAAGVMPKTGIARTYGLGDDAVDSHANNHVTAVMRRAERDRMLAHGESPNDQVRGGIEETLLILRGSLDRDQKLRAIDRLTRLWELLGKSTGQIQNDRVQIVFNNLGVKNESELKQIVETHRSLASEAVSLDRMREDWLELGRFVLKQEPGWRDEMREELFGKEGTSADLGQGSGTAASG